MTLERFARFGSVRSRFLMLATLLCLTTPAAAGAPGWYVNVEAGGNAVDDAQNRSGTPPTVTPGTPATCQVQLPGGPCLVQGNAGTPPAVTPGQDQTSELRFANGYYAGFTIGHRFEQGARPELSFRLAENDFESLTLQQGFGAQDGTTIDEPPGSARVLSVFSNLWYDIDIGSVLTPYAGAGIGFRHIEFDGGDSNNSAEGDDSDLTFGYQLGAGVGLRMSELWTLSLDYRYQEGANPDFRDNQNSRFESEYAAHSVGLSLAYVFSPTQAADTDGDGVPDYKDQCPGTPREYTVDRKGCPVDSDGDGVFDHLDKCPGTPAGMATNAQGCALDSDGDGVPDQQDQCPNTPADAPVDSTGCPLDTDGDGVPDYKDQCPNSPAGQQIDARGCAFTDADNDGIADFADKCPGTPPGVPVGDDGCPLDSDGDGVPDYLDECPRTPPGLKVLANGCALKGDRRLARPGEPADAEGFALTRDFILRGVNFEFDSNRLTPEAMQILNDVAETLKAYPDVRVDVEGHTDGLGSDGYNLSLSEKRAVAVVNYLIIRGIPPSQMRPVGYGETQPIDSNFTEAGRSNNRRVAFTVRD